MAGIRTAQYTTSSTIGDPTLLTAILDIALMDPTTLINAIPIVPLSNVKHYVRSAEAMMNVSNATNVRLFVRAYRLECIKYCPYTIATLLDKDAPSFVVPYIDPTTSIGFRRYFHISDHRVETIPVGGSLTFALSSYYPQGKLVDGDVEANANSYEYVPGSKVWIVFFNNQPVESVAVGLLAGPSAPKVNYFINNKYTYYVLEDSNPESVAASFGTPVAAANVISDSTRVPFQTDNM